MIKFVVKVGIATAAVYFLKEEGVWKESTESLKVYDKINDNLGPYVKEVRKQIPIEIPQFPDYRITSLSKETWNRGVMATFEFLSCLPSTVSGLVKANAPKVRQLFDGPSKSAIEGRSK